MKSNFSYLFLLFLFSSVIIGQNKKGSKMSNNNTEFAILGGGCFCWVEVVFERIDGVSEVKSG